MLQPITEAQRNQQIASGFFYTLGDLLGGSDSQPRYEPGMSTASGMATSWGFGADGVLYERGRTAGIAQQPAPISLLGVPLSLPLLLVVGVAAFLLLRR